MTTLSTHPLPHIVLIGLESVGKSALFRALTGYAAGDETNYRGSTVRVRSVLKKFLGEAMPIFLAMCAVGAILELVGLLNWLAQGVGPLLGLIGLPPDVAPGVIFSIIRKDGLLILNQGEGALLASLSSGQIFVLVYFSSTLTACVVTLWTVQQEMGSRAALALTGRQAGTAVLTTLLLVLLLSAW
ncbi:MAG: hypothetical protein R6X32_22870 [Chloroflexota bacterium]